MSFISYDEVDWPKAECVVVDEKTFDAWCWTFGGRTEPFVYDGKQWICTGICHPAHDSHGYGPASYLEANLVVPQEVYPFASFEHRQVSAAPGTPGLIERIGHATKGQPYVYDVGRLLAAVNCGHETEGCPRPARIHRSELGLMR
jgi:hypothetical protein